LFEFHPLGGRSAAHFMAAARWRLATVPSQPDANYFVAIEKIDTSHKIFVISIFNFHHLCK